MLYKNKPSNVKDVAIYYNIDNMQKEIYNKALSNERFNNLTSKVCSKDNILYAIKKLMSKVGSNKSGPDKLTIKDILNKDMNENIKCIRDRLDGIIKPEFYNNSKLYTFNIYDRIAQQALLNILECILEPQFEYNSCAFRRGKSRKDAVAIIANKVVNASQSYIFSTDISNYFDTAKLSTIISLLEKNHNIKDLKFLKMINRLIKINDDHLIQGSLITPMLSNVLLHDMELFIKSKTSRISSKRSYMYELVYKHGYDKYRLWANKEYMAEIVRYADAFVIISPFKKDLDLAINDIHEWLKKYQLELNNSKTSVLEYSKEKDLKLNFLGYRINKTSNGFYISVADQQKMWDSLKTSIKHCLKTGDCIKLSNIISNSIRQLDICSNIEWLITSINHILYKDTFKRVRYNIRSEKLEDFDGKFYKIFSNKHPDGISLKLWNIRKQTKVSVSRYGKNPIWDPNIISNGISYLNNWSSEVIDYRIFNTDNQSKYTMYINGLAIKQKREPIMDIPLNVLRPTEVHIHHIIPINKGGLDTFTNLIILDKKTHYLVHAQDLNEVKKIIANKKINLKKLNHYRLKAGNDIINI